MGRLRASDDCLGGEVTNPNQLDQRLTAVETKNAQQDTQLATIAGNLQSAQNALAKAVTDFSPVAARVTELSAAFLDANQRLSEVETSLMALQMPEDPGMDLAQQVNALRDTLNTLTARVELLATTRARSGRISTRLTSIEDILRQMQQGGTT